MSFSEGLKEIDDDAFYMTLSLRTVAFPSSLTYIGSRAFSYSGLTGEVTIPAGVVNKEWFYAFSDCPNLRSINVAEDNPKAASHQGVVYNKEKTMLKLMPEGFEGEYTVLPGTTFIGCYYETESSSSYTPAIVNCNKLTALHIPATVTIIGSGSLRRNPQLTTVTVDEASESFTVDDGVLFDKQKKTLYWISEKREGSYQIPDGVEALTSYVFRYAEKLQHVIVPSSVNKLGYDVFSFGCQNKITWMRDEPLTLESVALVEIYDRYYASSVVFAFDRHDYYNSETGEYEVPQCTLYVPDNSVEAYKSDPEWGRIGFFDILPISSAGIEEHQTAGHAAATPKDFFTLDGKRISHPQSGLNIVRMSDGTTRKVVVR